MARRNEGVETYDVLPELASRAGGRGPVLRSLLAGTLLLALWLSLWTWLVAGVARPLSAAEAALRGEAPASVIDGT